MSDVNPACLNCDDYVLEQGLLICLLISISICAIVTASLYIGGKIVRDRENKKRTQGRNR